MLELYIIRHGLAGKRVKTEAKDKSRRLTKKGKEKMKAIAKGIDKHGIGFDAVITSPYVRAKETADILHRYCGQSNDVIATDLLAPEGSYQQLMRFLNQLKKLKRVAIVGHEPFLSSFVSLCLSGKENSFIKLKKGSVLKLDINQSLKPGKCTLSWLLEPKHLIR